MSNWLLFGLMTVVVIVNVYFTYRRTEGVDDTGRKLLAASQLLYLLFIAVIFGLGWFFKVTGIAAKMQAGGTSMPVFIGSIAIVALVLALLLYLKRRLEQKIREEHSI